MSKPIRMRCAGYVARIGSKRNAYRIFVGKPEGKRPLKGQDVSGWTILKWILDSMRCYGPDRCGSGKGPVEGSCEHGNKPSGSINCWKVLE
jgi:hypothetical protein